MTVANVLDWITRIKNVCVQSGRSLCQELIYRAGIVVQNYITSLDTTLSEKEMEQKVLQHFSNIPTTTQAIEKLKSLQQGKNESILANNQRYKVLDERVEGRPIKEVQSAVAMEMYPGTIVAPLRRNIKNNLLWNSKHAPKNLGEAMKKIRGTLCQTPVLLSDRTGRGVHQQETTRSCD